VVGGPTRTINAPFIEVYGFSHTYSHIWHIVHFEGFVGPCTVRALPLVNLHMSIFSQLYSFLPFEMHFSAVGELIFVDIVVFL
jgi:hypothetical protein